MYEMFVSCEKQQQWRRWRKKKKTWMPCMCWTQIVIRKLQGILFFCTTTSQFRSTRRCSTYSIFAVFFLAIQCSIFVLLLFFSYLSFFSRFSVGTAKIQLRLCSASIHGGCSTRRTKLCEFRLFHSIRCKLVFAVRRKVWQQPRRPSSRSVSFHCSMEIMCSQTETVYRHISLTVE